MVATVRPDGRRDPMDADGPMDDMNRQAKKEGSMGAAAYGSTDRGRIPIGESHDVL